MTTFKRLNTWGKAALKRSSNYNSNEVLDFSIKLFQDSSMHKTIQCQRKISRLKKTSKTSLTSVCLLSGRSKSVMTKFKISRIKFRSLALSGKLPGIRKASW